MMEKLVSMQTAMARFVHDGDSVAIGCALEALIPFAAGHELIRQGRRDLTVIGPISDILFDQLIGAGCVARVTAAWAGNAGAGLGYGYRRAAEQGIPRAIEVRDHSNFSLALALQAAALGVPFIPAHTLLGSDLLDTNPDLRVVDSPLGGGPLLLVPALVPDVTILHVQRADVTGGVHAWGNLGVCQEAALAARRLVIVAEEIVPTAVIRSDPNRVLVPPFKVTAVVHEPGGAHPAPVQGVYNRDHAFFQEYHAATRTHGGMEDWLAAWVYGVDDRAAYLAKVGQSRWEALARRGSLLAAPVDYGF